MTEKCYNIHGILSFKIIDRRNSLKRIFSELEIEYSHFEVQEQLNCPDFTIIIENNVIAPSDSFSLDDQFFVNKQSLYGFDSYKLDRWTFSFSNFDNSNTVFLITSNLFGNMHISRITNFLIYLKLAEKGVPIVHASAVSKNGKGFLFPSSSGGGKTTLSSFFVGRGYKFLGDNLIILKDGLILSFPSPLRIFSYNLSPKIKSTLDLKSRISLSLKTMLYTLTGGYAKVFLRLNAKDVFGSSIVDTTECKTVYLIAPGEKLGVSELSKEMLIEHLILNQEVEFSNYLKFMLEYSFMFTESFIASYFNFPKTKQRDNLTKALGQKFKAYKLEVPPRYNPVILEKIFNVINNSEIKQDEDYSHD